MNSNFRNFAIWVFIALLLVALFNLFQSPGVHVRGNEISFSQLLSEVESGNVQDVTIAGNQITGHFTDGRNFQTYAPNDPNLVDKLNQKGVKITAKPSDEDVPSLLGVLLSWFPMLLLIAVWIFFMRQMQSGGGRAMGFGKSKAKLLTERHGPRHLRRRGWGRRGEGGFAGDRRVPARSAEIPEARRAHPARRSAGRPSGHRQDAACARDRRRSQRAVLHHLGLRLRRDVRGRGRLPRARHVRPGEEERALHHLHRRDRRRRPPSRRRPRRRQRRARADAEPAARRDGRLRGE